MAGDGSKIATVSGKRAFVEGRLHLNGGAVHHGAAGVVVCLAHPLSGVRHESDMTRGLWLAALSIPVLVMATELPSQRYQLALDPAARPVQTPVLNAEKALAEDALADKGAPLRYAIMHKAAVSLADRSKFAVGRWDEVDSHFDLWRTRIDAPGAVSIDLALKPFHLPQGAEVWLTDAAGTLVRGPYTAADNPKSGEFWTPYVPGDVAYLEVLVPKRTRSVATRYFERATGLSLDREW
ncbi:MAG: hypothetical protein IPH50_03925 [Rhodanobacteraceae bacterium]|nr:hypothetical protein [Rhodanobacteraceae bacterium]